MQANICFTPFADIITAIYSHIGTLTDTISLDLPYFSAKFVESGFVTQAATTDVLTKQGISNREQASQLLNLVTTNYKIAQQKQEWVSKFIAIFSSKPAYAGLAVLLTGETCTSGIVMISSILNSFILFLQFFMSCNHWSVVFCNILLSRLSAHPVRGYEEEASTANLSTIPVLAHNLTCYTQSMLVIMEHGYCYLHKLPNIII